MAKQTGPQMTIPTQLVRALLANSAGPMYGLQICAQAGLPSGTVHPILARLEGLGWLESNWEDTADAYQEGRPRRRYYWLSESYTHSQGAQFCFGSNERKWTYVLGRQYSSFQGTIGLSDNSVSTAKIRFSIWS